MKSTLDRVHNELDILDTDLNKFATKGYPWEMQKEQAEDPGSANRLLEKAHDKYSTEAMRAITDQESIQDLEATVTSWDHELQQVTAQWSDWKKEGGDELTKLVH